MKARFALAAFLLLAMGTAAYHSFSGSEVQVTEDGIAPPPSFP